MKQKCYKQDRDETDEKGPESLHELQPNNSGHVQKWHTYTKELNVILLLVTKSLLLLVVAVITTQVSLAFYMTIFGRVYGVDCCINIYCMYLSFRFSSKLWTRVFCGEKCIYLSFPFIKMWTIIGCKLQCCKDNNVAICNCKIYDDKRKNVRKLIQREYQLFVEKSFE